MRYLLALVVLMFGASNPAYAKWPTTIWTILDDPSLGAQPPIGERKIFAQKYKESLEHASFWFQSMSFQAPYQLNEEGRLSFEGGERYVGFLNANPLTQSSTHGSSGKMMLSTHRGFLKPTGSVEELFEASAVHELFHGIQKANPEYYNYATTEEPGPQECYDDETADDWLTEGSASAVQIQYMERTHAYTYGHGLKGSPRITWARFFDQPLDWGRFKPYTPTKTPSGNFSWQCAYGTWYFWYAVGNMLGSKDPRDWRRTAYLRYIFEQKGGWRGTGLAKVDAGLKQAAQKLNAIAPYHGGLYALYPQFVAQYLDVDEFYENVENVVLTVPSLYELKSKAKGEAKNTKKNELTSIQANDLIEPVATRVWRFRIQPPTHTTPMPYTVRFVLESPEQSSRDGLHLIVGNEVIARPIDPDSPYSYTRRTDLDAPNEQGEFEYFVRLANVAHDAAATQPAEFTLRVEVEGFYGEKTGPSNQSIAGELPPGFEISGPGKYWTCLGGDDARASFTIITPDGHADQLERMLPQGLKNLESDLDRAELDAHAKGPDAELKLIQQERRRFEASMQSMIENGDVNDKVTQAAKEIRRKDETYVQAKLYGTNAEGSCNVMFSVTLPGRQPVAQKVTGRHFSITITPESMGDALDTVRNFAATLELPKMDTDNITEADILRLVQQMKPFTESPSADFEEPGSGWTSCSFNERGCDVGELTLEHARLDHLSGTFNFRVSRSNREDHRQEYGDVTGFINITSAQTQNSDSLLDFMSRGERVGEPLYLPGIEKLLPGGSMFGK
ncbi:hypothetical protein [Pusillimonas sp. ANT_WB101]|uniref:hypothetical protein n=1 Tax=Pusillimonas sp. ANT_WB101 TaxID=2597356 RepID=UPI0011ED98CD|nr:hypothetical protein [Pusillimonas sp. ANT_WB101]KAA0911477.1 hypothetical protein FQ179_06540 [Pusillimonas sp. ANT_WB101]